MFHVEHEDGVRMASYTSQPIDHVPSRPETAISSRLSYVCSTF